MAAFGTVLAFRPSVADRSFLPYRPNCQAAFFNLAAKLAGGFCADYQSGNDFAAASPDILAGFCVQNRFLHPELERNGLFHRDFSMCRPRWHEPCHLGGGDKGGRGRSLCLAELLGSPIGQSCRWWPWLPPLWRKRQPISRGCSRIAGRQPLQGSSASKSPPDGSTGPRAASRSRSRTASNSSTIRAPGTRRSRGRA